jgi:HD-GYP domain-containing protein (c-di-GMP phosphodiesterase class II)
MMRRLSLTTRIFLFALFSVCFLGGAGFWTLNRAIRHAIQDRLKESFQTSSQLLDEVETRYRRRSIQLLSVVSENAGLKAALGLLREVPSGPAGQQQVRKTIEANLFEIGRGLEYRIMLVTDSVGHPVAGTISRPWGTIPLDPLPVSVEPSSLIEVQATLYEATTVPINLGSENLGSLTVAREFDLASWSLSGETVLVTQGKIRRSTLPEDRIAEVEPQLQHCVEAEGCEISIAGESYLALPLERADWETHYRLFGLQSLDAATQEFTRDFLGIFLWIGLTGTCGAALLAFLGSRSVSKPITNLIVRLKASQQSGRLRADFPHDSAVEEVNLLTAALNEAATAVEDSHQRLEEASLEFIETMARALDARDPYTAGHSDRVSANATAIADVMGLPEHEVEIIRIGAKMHDIGKIGAPDAVLQKPGPLNEEEMAMIRLHPQIGKRILEKSAPFREYLPIVELHHEDYDGGGYPYGLHGEEVPLGVRIVHVADVYDAITSDRAYRPAMPPEQVREILQRGSGTKFDPRVIDVFLGILRERQTLDNLLNEIISPSCYEPPSMR